MRYFVRSVLVIAIAVGGFGQSTAGASCAGPHLDSTLIPGEVLRGQEIVVHGEYFGYMDASNGSECPLGTPRSDIEIVFVQGGDDTVVARGSADHDYEFLLEVVVPSSLRPGPALLGARLPEFEDPIAFQVNVADVRPFGLHDEGVRTFGDPTDQRAATGFGAWPVVLGVVALAAIFLVRRLE